MTERKRADFSLIAFLRDRVMAAKKRAREKKKQRLRSRIDAMLPRDLNPGPYQVRCFHFDLEKEEANHKSGQEDQEVLP